MWLFILIRKIEIPQNGSNLLLPDPSNLMHGIYETNITYHTKALLLITVSKPHTSLQTRVRLENSILNTYSLNSEFVYRAVIIPYLAIEHVTITLPLTLKRCRATQNCQVH